MSTFTTFIQLSFGSPIQIHQAIKRKSRHPNLKGRGKIDTICTLKSKSAIHSVLSDSLQPQELQPARPLCPWDSPGKNTGVSCHSFLQGIFLTQGLNPGLLHCRQILYHQSSEERNPLHDIVCRKH